MPLSNLNLGRALWATGDAAEAERRYKTAFEQFKLTGNWYLCAQELTVSSTAKWARTKILKIRIGERRLYAESFKAPDMMKLTKVEKPIIGSSQLFYRTRLAGLYVEYFPQCVNMWKQRQGEYIFITRSGSKFTTHRNRITMNLVSDYFKSMVGGTKEIVADYYNSANFGFREYSKLLREAESENERGEELEAFLAVPLDQPFPNREYERLPAEEGSVIRLIRLLPGEDLEKSNAFLKLQVFM
ncbi:hypothetical protein GP486_003246 [Trichoglossum hirsutum]|uniref:Uncharacterized protein n=1 Tax=Trichoglossum hirsutum TaxID=265104 RepID=A0A9P8RQX5_9PEZI|nr:hypothetical protein GP486_003246 [Trichoglossum hirsutum]